MWTDSVAINFVLNLLAGFIIFVVGLRWRLIISYLSREHAAFRRVFGRAAHEAGLITVTLDTYRDVRLLSEPVRKAIGIKSTQPSSVDESRFFKVFPDGHWTALRSTYGDVIRYCSARGAAYVVEELAHLIAVRVVSDVDVSPQWSGTFVNIGSSTSNIKTDAIKHFPENPWLLDDIGGFTFKDGYKEEMEERLDKGIILKLPNPYFRGYSVIVCAGLGEWGTSGAASFLAREWKKLAKRFGRSAFLVLISVTPGADESGHELLAFGKETISWKIISRIARGRPRAKHFEDQNPPPTPGHDWSL
jgi:hypothetical protein